MAISRINSIFFKRIQYFDKLEFDRSISGGRYLVRYVLVLQAVPELGWLYLMMVGKRYVFSRKRT